MVTILKQKLNIDKTNWTLVKFGDVAFEPKEMMKSIVSDGIEHVVGLEHITTDDIHLRNSAGISESTTFTKKFAKGDVLFGRRRAYLRKAAQASFDGICSGDITVFRVKKVLLPELLPFIVNNDKFFDYAIKHSAGGLSPRVKFKDLADYEFLLPPKDQQAQLAELLWAMDEVIENEIEVLEKINILISTSRRSHFIAKDGVKKVLCDIAKVRAGIGFPIKHQGKKNELIKFFKVGDMNTASNERYLNISDHTISFDTLNKLKGKLHTKGTIVFPKVGAAIATEKKRILIEDSVVDNNTMGVSLIDNEIIPEYLHDYFISISLDSISNNGTVPSINAKIIESLEFYKPTIDKMNFYLQKIESIYKAELKMKSKIISSKAIQKSIINQVF